MSAVRRSVLGPSLRLEFQTNFQMTEKIMKWNNRESVEQIMAQKQIIRLWVIPDMDSVPV